MKIPWRRECLPTPVFLPRESHRQGSGRLQSMESQRVRHDWATNLVTAALAMSNPIQKHMHAPDKSGEERKGEKDFFGIVWLSHSLCGYDCGWAWVWNRYNTWYVLHGSPHWVIGVSQVYKNINDQLKLKNNSKMRQLSLFKNLGVTSPSWYYWVSSLFLMSLAKEMALVCQGLMFGGFSPIFPTFPIVPVTACISRNLLLI